MDSNCSLPLTERDGNRGTTNGHDTPPSMDGLLPYVILSSSRTPHQHPPLSGSSRLRSPKVGLLFPQSEHNQQPTAQHRLSGRGLHPWTALVTNQGVAPGRSLSSTSAPEKSLQYPSTQEKPHRMPWSVPHPMADGACWPVRPWRDVPAWAVKQPCMGGTRTLAAPRSPVSGYPRRPGQLLFKHCLDHAEDARAQPVPDRIATLLTRKQRERTGGCYHSLCQGVTSLAPPAASQVAFMTRRRISSLSANVETRPTTIISYPCQGKPPSHQDNACRARKTWKE